VPSQQTAQAGTTPKGVDPKGFGEARQTWLVIKPRPVAFSRLKIDAAASHGRLAPASQAALSPIDKTQRKRSLTSPIIEFLLKRNSVPIPLLRDPAPTDAEIATIIEVATRVPDHGQLSPWRFILYRGQARSEIGKRLAALADTREGPLPEGRLEKELTRFSRAPLVIGVVSSPKESPKNIPQWEQFLSGGAAAMNLVIAANALGYGTNWISNWYSDDQEGRAILGLAPHENVIGFVHIGTASGAAPERPRPDISRLYADYSGPWEKQQHVL
jgi:nitroreductase